MRQKNMMYMHTLNGCPAICRDGKYVSFAGKHMRIPEDLRPSLKVIRREQSISQDDWMKMNPNDKYAWTYGYLRVTI
jgi:hypothetical protein